jgi:hypothetical protein
MKTTLLSATAAVLICAGCSENIAKKSDSSVPGSIYLQATTTRTSRAAVATVPILQADPAGFRVYGTAANESGNWYDGGSGQVIDGSNNHLFGVDGQWGFATPVKWPSDGTAYPMSFYAFYPASPEGLAMETPESPDNLKGTYTVPASAAEQTDLLAARATTGSYKPPHDILNLTFNHILSKVNYNFGIETGYDAYIQALVVENVATERVYDFIDGRWTPDSAPEAADCTGGYLYFGFLADGRTAIRNTTARFTGNDTNTPAYTATDNASLMLMPQNVTAQTWSADGDLPGNRAYVRMIYRMEKTSGTITPDYTGYANASHHPDYAGSQAETDGYTGALFVAVGYPFTLNWEAGKGYTYNIMLPGTSGGILLESNYYNEAGQKTDLTVKNVTPGDSILGDGYIHLEPEVEEWTETENTMS